jgi:hypothetical protein
MCEEHMKMHLRGGNLELPQNRFRWRAFMNILTILYVL